MRKFLCRRIGLVVTLNLIVISWTTTAFAEDWRQFQSMATQTINAIKNGKPEDIDKLIVLQERLMEIGIQACKRYAINNPPDAKLFTLVVDNAENMKLLSLKEIKLQWHAKRYLLSQGIAVDKLQQNSPTGSLLDTVIHPATAYIALREYRHTKNIKLLEQVNLELSEAIVKLTYLAR